MARSVIRHMAHKLPRRLRTASVVKYGLFLTVFIFLVFLLCILRNPIAYSESELGNIIRRVVRSNREVAGVVAIPEHDPPPGRVGPGEMGESVNITKEGLPPEEAAIFQELYDRNSFNQYASDLISVKRQLPDMRSANCKEDAKRYSKKLPDTSVIVCFHNEAWSTLLRSVHSILDRSPSHLLKEIVLVDDASTQDHLKERLDNYMAKFSKVKVVRAPSRIGLIKGRILGYKHATGTVLTFLDSHIECTPGWLEPLLDRISQNWSNVVWPVIDGINMRTFEFKDGGVGTYGTQTGGFDWGLQFNWHMIPERDNKTRPHTTAPIRSPTMAGGLFSIDRKYFEHLGTYDTEMDIWGGENLELSFKVWMCGGTLEMVLCSRVGHIYREVSPYKWRDGKDVLKKNLVRLAEVWMDDYKKYYYERINHDLGDFGDISERVDLRKRLKCKSFQWYMETIFPEMFIPDKAIAYGQIQNEAQDGKYCLDASDQKGSNKTVDVYPCHGQGGNQYYSYTNGSEIRRDDSCVDYGNGVVILFPCHSMGGNQLWTHDREAGTIYNHPSDRCLEMRLSPDTVIPARCNASLPEQRWYFSVYTEDEIDNTTQIITDSEE